MAPGDEKSADRGKIGIRTALGRWTISLGATAVSTYALDAIATAAGLLLVVSQLLSGLPDAAVTGFLAASYLVWAAGLRVNLGANWCLLEDTGTSINILSKAAHSLVGARTDNVLARRIAAAAGYIGSEIAKETPYYAGAIGAAAWSEQVSAVEAMIFLGGANLGAAAYEYGLGRMVRAFLARRRDGYASFEADWSARDYLTSYYSAVEPDERRTIRFFVEGMRDAAPGEAVLVFGVGPTLHHVFPAAEVASEIHLGDFLPSNLREIARWLGRDALAHDWRPFVAYTLECEGHDAAAPGAIARREDLVRGKISRLLPGDLRRSQPLGPERTRYATVISAYCADSATDDGETWQLYMHRLIGLVRLGGLFMTAALRHSRGYFVGARMFPSANVDEADLRALLGRYFDPENLVVEVCELGTGARGYSSIILARGRQKRAVPMCEPIRGRDGALTMIRGNESSAPVTLSCDRQAAIVIP